jgi:glycine C-acetyltransferase/8-amino-7-oxononanoate synthase
MNPSLADHCRVKLEEIEAAGLLRRLRTCQQNDTRTILYEGRSLLNFSSNDYLGLSTHPRIRKALESETFGAGASRLISGNHSGYDALEAEIARFKKAESALVFTSGYAAAVGTIPVLTGEGDCIVMDKLCHACLVDGARLSGATIRVFPHSNLKRCGELLASCRERVGSEGNVLLVTESVFSMDGDLAPLDQLVELKNKHGAWLMVDEAHATGVMGRNGRGGAEHFGVEEEVEISMGTLSKALGCVGGFICGSRELKEYLVNRARSLIYSTALPAAVCQAASEAVRVAWEETGIREKLWKNIHFLSDRLGVKAESPIFPIAVGDERRCVAIAEKLRETGFLVPAVRYPTVGRGKARLRVSVSAAHQESDLIQLAESLRW